MTALDEIAAERRPAFPGQPLGTDGLPAWEAAPGISRLDYFVAHAPLTAADAYGMWSEERHSQAAFGSAFIAFWAQKRVELARAMIAEIERLDRAAQETPDAP